MGWIILLAILLALGLLLIAVAMLWVRFIVRYGEDLSIDVRVLFFRYSLYPEEAKKIRIKKYSRENMAKMAEKQRRKAEKKAARDEKKRLKKAAKGVEKPQTPRKRKVRRFAAVSDTVLALRKFLAVLFGRFFPYLRVEKARVRITVAGGDAASTAMQYGTTVTAVAVLSQYLTEVMRFDPDRQGDILVQADFLKEKTEADIYLRLRLHLWQLLKVVISAFVADMKDLTERMSR